MMKKSTLLIITILSLSTFVNAQWTITPYARVDYSNKTAHEVIVLMGCDYPERGYSRPKFGGTVGIDLNYDFTPNWSLKTGLMFQEMGNNIPRYQLYISDIKGYLNQYGEVTLQFISVPIQAQYNFNSKKRFSPYIALGTALNINILNDESRTHFYSNEGIKTTTILSLSETDYTMRRFNISTKIDVGFNHKLTEKVSLNSSISLNRLMLSISENRYLTEKYYNIGLGLGIGYVI